MSHTSTYGQKITNTPLFCKVAKDKGYEVREGEQMVKLFGRSGVQAVASIKIDGWMYPLAITAEGEVKYDHFGSKPGTMPQLGLLCQDYNEQAALEKVPYDLVENYYIEELKNGDRKLILEYGT